jgi:hypothetical protein
MFRVVALVLLVLSEMDLLPVRNLLLLKLLFDVIVGVHLLLEALLKSIVMLVFVKLKLTDDIVSVPHGVSKLTGYMVDTANVRLLITLLIPLFL